MTLVTSIINFKGGVAKTTTSINLGAGLRKIGERVLVIDTDPQGNVGINLQGSEDAVLGKNLTISHLYRDSRIDPTKSIIQTPYFDYIPNNLYSYELTSGLNDYRLLKQIIEKLKPYYDHIVIDTPPYLGLEAINAIYASDNLLLVTDFSKASLTGVQILVNVLDRWHDKEIAKVFKEKAKSILFTMFQRSTNLHNELINATEDSKEIGAGIMLKQRIPRALKVVEDGYLGVPTIIASPRTKVALEYKSLAETWKTARLTKTIYGSRYDAIIKK